MAKKYLTMIGIARKDNFRGAYAHIGYYKDTPNRNLRIYYCGSDTGDRFEYLGNASKNLENLRAAWIANGTPEESIKCMYQTRDEFLRMEGIVSTT